MKHPLQAIATDEHGTIRFVKNEIVDHLVDRYPGGLNSLACQGFSAGDWEQLAQQIGYSVSGFGDLSYASPTAVRIADRKAAELMDRPVEQQTSIATVTTNAEGWLEGEFDPEQLREYLNTHGRQGKKDLLEHIAYLQHQIIEMWHEVE